MDRRKFLQSTIATTLLGPTLLAAIKHKPTLSAVIKHEQVGPLSETTISFRKGGNVWTEVIPPHASSCKCGKIHAKDLLFG